MGGELSDQVLSDE